MSREEEAEMKRIDFEAHFLSKPLEQALRARKDAPCLTEESNMIFGPDCILPYGGIAPALADLTDRRIEEMDRAGVDVQILSNVGGVELLPAQVGAQVARQSNDILAQAVQRHPERLKGYACLAPQNVDEAVEELERCITQLGFVGWNAFSNFGQDALDDPKYFPLLQKLDQLGGFLYLHPTMPTIDRLHGYGRQLVASGLGFGIDVMITLTRMILGGVFDRLPDLKVVLGHLGEGFPFVMDRMRARGPKQNRLPAVNELPAKDYLTKNVWVSTSGNYSEAAFRCTLETMGAERILLGSDYPMEALKDSVDFLDGMRLTKSEREAISCRNSEKLIHTP